MHLGVYVSFRLLTILLTGQKSINLVDKTTTNALQCRSDTVLWIARYVHMKKHFQKYIHTKQNDYVFIRYDFTR